MDFPKYNGNIHPDEWINDIQKYLRLINKDYTSDDHLEIAISLVSTTISLPTGIDNLEKLRNALREDIFFTIFKNTNKRKLQSLKYIPESRGALKHVATGKYLNSVEDLHYRTGSGHQTVFVGSLEPGLNSLWKIKFDKELATYASTSIKLQHVKSKNKFLGTYSGYKSPSSNHTEVSCNNISYDSTRVHWVENWKFNHNKFENHQGYLKSNDIIHLSIKKTTNDRGHYTQHSQVEFLYSHDVRFTIGDDNFQEVFCHNESLGGNDEWCIELIKQYIWTIDD
ncbi:hypothetical protein GLOIN_2v1543793 [Rhizophagus irregularis DAOM 181602=DAOM 197198]|nr:hypothetical protein GLOIN_2v1543793 [Rhizophagus irregularis DAOM 181602=DAOM 197198]